MVGITCLFSSRHQFDVLNTNKNFKELMRITNHTNITLPLNVHNSISEYLSMEDLASVSQVSGSLRSAYLAKLYSRILVVPDTHSQRYHNMPNHENRHAVPLDVFINPQNYSWFLAELVKDVEFMTSCFTLSQEKAIKSLCKKLMKKHHKVFKHPKIVHKHQPSSEGTMSSFSHEIEGDLAFTFPAIKFLYPCLQSATFSQNSYHNGMKDTLNHTLVAGFLDMMPSLNLQLTDIHILTEMKNCSSISSLELLLCDKKYYKKYANAVLDKSGKDMLLLSNSDNDTIIKMTNKMTNLKTLNFYPPSGITLRQYESIMIGVSKIPTLEYTTTGHYYSQLEPTLEAVSKLPNGLKKCEIKLLILDSSKDHYQNFNNSSLFLPQVTAFELHMGMNWLITPQDIKSKITDKLDLPNLSHFVDMTGSVSDNGSFYFDTHTMGSLTSLKTVIKSNHSSGLSTTLPLLYNGISTLKSLRSVSISECEFSGMAEEIYKKKPHLYKNIVEELGDFYHIASSNFSEFVELSDEANEKGGKLDASIVEYFEECMVELMPNFGKGLIPKSLAIESLLNPEKFLHDNYGMLAWPITRPYSISGLTGTQHQYYWEVMAIISSHCFWEVMFKKLQKLEKLEYLEIQASNMRYAGYHGFNEGPELKVLDMPRFKSFVKTHVQLKQVCMPDYECCHKIYSSDETVIEDNELKVYLRELDTNRTDMYMFGQYVKCQTNVIRRILDVKAYRCEIDRFNAVMGQRVVSNATSTKNGMESNNSKNGNVGNVGNDNCLQFQGWL